MAGGGKGPAVWRGCAGRGPRIWDALALPRRMFHVEHFWGDGLRLTARGLRLMLWGASLRRRLGGCRGRGARP